MFEKRMISCKEDFEKYFYQVHNKIKEKQKI